MRHFRPRIVAAGIAMFLGAGLAVALTPTRKLSDERPPLELETVIPTVFGDWKVDPTVVPVQVSPDVQAKLDKIYNQTLARTYINSRGERIMLSVAYGGDQSDQLQVHRPEVCYAAQGFQVLRTLPAVLALGAGSIPIKRVVAVSGPRHEPITYWVTVGDDAPAAGLRQKLTQLRYGFAGTVPDGMLVRISSISSDEAAAYHLHDAFAAELLAAVPADARVRFAGRLAG